MNDTSVGSVDVALFDIDEEKQLWETFQTKVVSVWERDGQFHHPSSAQDYQRMLELLKAIVKPVDAFFEKVMVNDPDTAKKNNRQGLLRLIYHYFASVADYPKLQPLLP